MSGNNQDTRPCIVHEIHAIGHSANYLIKDLGGKGIETWPVYRATSPQKAKQWSKEVDNNRSQYHLKQWIEKGCWK